MTDIRQPYLAAATANLDWSELRERPIDRLAAAGRVSTLGILIWCAKYLGESRARSQLFKDVLKLYRERYRDRFEVAEMIVGQALTEFLAPQCLTCRGAKEILRDNRIIECPTCKGVGVRKYDDETRARTMQISVKTTQHCAHKIGWIVNKLTTEDRLVNYEMSQQLERA